MTVYANISLLSLLVALSCVPILGVPFSWCTFFVLLLQFYRGKANWLAVDFRTLSISGFILWRGLCKGSCWLEVAPISFTQLNCFIDCRSIYQIACNSVAHEAKPDTATFSIAQTTNEYCSWAWMEQLSTLPHQRVDWRSIATLQLVFLFYGFCGVDQKSLWWKNWSSLTLSNERH